MTPLEWILFAAAPYLIFAFGLGVNLFSNREPKG